MEQDQGLSGVLQLPLLELTPFQLTLLPVNTLHLVCIEQVEVNMGIFELDLGHTLKMVILS